MGKLKNKTKLEKDKTIRHITYSVYYTAYLPLPQYIIPKTSPPITHASL
jgi:hypothetical protein